MGSGKAHLTVIEGTLNSHIVNVSVHYGGHLSLLDGRDASFGVKNKDGYIRFVP